MSELTWAQRSDAVIAQGALTMSKRRDQFIEGVYPTHSCGGGRHWIFPMDGSASGRAMVDYVCGLGANLLDVRNSFSLPHVYEIELAERVKALFPCIDKLKILKTGSDACSAAVRIARAWAFNECTKGGKRGWAWITPPYSSESVWGVGYHGTHDNFICAESPGTGTIRVPYEKFDTLERLCRELDFQERSFERWKKCLLPAAIIIEPVQLDLNVVDYLKKIRAFCTRFNTVLIFDEIITGFRVPKYSFSNYFGIQPDLVCLGKALGNGYPISIVGGREDIMETPGYFISNTHNGELSGIKAALATLDFLSEEKLQELWDKGEWFLREFNSLYPKVQIVGYPTRGELQGDEMTKALFMQEAVKRGQFFGRAWFHTFAHTREVMQKTLDVAKDVFREIEAGRVMLEGQLPRPVFRRN